MEIESEQRLLKMMKVQPEQSRAVLLSVLENMKENKIETNNVHSGYIKLCEKYNLKILHSGKISDLLSELDMFGIIKILHNRRKILINVSEEFAEILKKTLQESFPTTGI